MVKKLKVKTWCKCSDEHVLVEENTRLKKECTEFEWPHENWGSLVTDDGEVWDFNLFEDDPDDGLQLVFYPTFINDKGIREVDTSGWGAKSFRVIDMDSEESDEIENAEREKVKGSDLLTSEERCQQLIDLANNLSNVDICFLLNALSNRQIDIFLGTLGNTCVSTELSHVSLNGTFLQLNATSCDLDDLSTMEVFQDFMKKTNEDMVKRYSLESDDE